MIRASSVSTMKSMSSDPFTWRSSSVMVVLIGQISSPPTQNTL